MRSKVEFEIERVRGPVGDLYPVGPDHFDATKDYIYIALTVRGRVAYDYGYISGPAELCREPYQEIEVESAVSSTGMDWIDDLTEDEVERIELLLLETAFDDSGYEGDDEDWHAGCNLGCA